MVRLCAIVFTVAFLFISGVHRDNSHNEIVSPAPVISGLNIPPTVKIQHPAHNSIHPRNALVRYAITVSDPEDGESVYDEIPSDRIFLEVRFEDGRAIVADTAHAVSSQTRAAGAINLGLALVMKSDCFNCHQFRQRSIGPSFEEIASRYSAQRYSSDTLATRIIGGSKGIWGEAIMPAHPEFSKENAKKIATWILRTAETQYVDYVRGKHGTFRTISPPGREGFLVLKALYADNGGAGNVWDFQTGTDSVLVRCR